MPAPLVEGRGRVGSWKASTTLMPCIGTMNLQPVRCIAKVLPAACRQCSSPVDLPARCRQHSGVHGERVRELPCGLLGHEVLRRVCASAALMLRDLWVGE